MNRFGRNTSKENVTETLLQCDSTTTIQRTYPGLSLLILILCCAPWRAQDVIPAVPNEPIAPISSDECVAYGNAYQKVLNKINEAQGKYLTTSNHLDVVGAPMSCIQGGWSGGHSTFDRACVRIYDRWCRADLDKKNKFAACMEHVKENAMKREIMKKTLLPKKPPQSTTSDDEIDNAFNTVNSKGTMGGQNKLAKEVVANDVEGIKGIEKETFSELDQAFKDADFAELNRAMQGRPSVSPSPERRPPQRVEDPIAKFRNTAWQNHYYGHGDDEATTIRLDGNNRVTYIQTSQNNGTAVSQGTWTIEGNRLILNMDFGTREYQIRDGSVWDGDLEYRMTGNRQ